MTEDNSTDKNKLTLDERLKFLLESTESLHDQVAQFVEEGRLQRDETRLRFEHHERQQARQEASDKKHRRAILAAMQSYLAALDADGSAE